MKADISQNQKDISMLRSSLINGGNGGNKDGVDGNNNKNQGSGNNLLGAEV